MSEQERVLPVRTAGVSDVCKAESEAQPRIPARLSVSLRLREVLKIAVNSANGDYMTLEPPKSEGRVGEYRQALEAAQEAFELRDMEERARVAGGEVWREGEKVKGISFPSLDRQMMVPVGKEPPVWDDGEELPLKWSVLALHYVIGVRDKEASGEMVSYRHLPGGPFYMTAFLQRTGYLLQHFRKKPDDLVKAGTVLGGDVADVGDAGVVLPVFPRIPLSVIVWKGDEEFESEGSILFDSSIREHISSEDVAVLSELVLKRLIEVASS